MIEEFSNRGTISKVIQEKSELAYKLRSNFLNIILKILIVEVCRMEGVMVEATYISLMKKHLSCEMEEDRVYKRTEEAK